MQFKGVKMCNLKKKSIFSILIIVLRIILGGSLAPMDPLPLRESAIA